MSPTGVVKFYSEKRGYGFIDWEGEDAFFHFSEIEEESAQVLAAGDEIEFEVQEGARGPIAVNVKRRT